MIPVNGLPAVEPANAMDDGNDVKTWQAKSV